MIKEWKAREVKASEKKASKTPVPPPKSMTDYDDEAVVYYDGSGREDIQQGGAGCVVMVGEEQTCRVALLQEGRNAVIGVLDRGDPNPSGFGAFPELGASP